MAVPPDALAERFRRVVVGAPARPTPKQLGECEAGLCEVFSQSGHSPERVLEAATVDTLVAAFLVWWTGKTERRFRHMIGAELVERHGWHAHLEEAIRSLDGVELLQRTALLNGVWQNRGVHLEDVLRAWKHERYLLPDNVLVIGFQKTALVAQQPDAATITPSLADAAFESLMEWRHREPLLRRIRGWGLNEDLAQEIHQQLTLEFLRNGLAGFDTSQLSFGAYLSGAAWKKREDHRRRLARRGPSAPIDSIPEPPARPGGETERMEAAELISAALPRLAADNRAQYDALLLQTQGYTIQEIADAQNTPTGTAGVRVKRAREKLREIVEEMLNGRGGT
jgi:RNA polymerase sigma factor (sigma-70 family)